MQLVTFSLNDTDYGIALKDVESIDNRKQVVNVPTAPRYIRGIIRLHGEIVPVFRLAARFGVEEGQIENLIVVNVDGMKVGLEVGRVKEIVDVENDGMLPMPVLVNSERNCFHDVASCKKELIVVLDVGSLISMEEQRQLRRIIDEGKENADA